MLLIIMGIAPALSDEVSGINFYSPAKGVFIIDIDTLLCNKCIDIYFSDALETVENVVEKTNALAGINGGFFDPNNKKTISYIYKNNRYIGNPWLNESLINNNVLKKYLDKIFNRAEFRILNCSNTYKYSINYHSEQTKQSCTLVSSIQAGPILLDKMDLEKEFFVLKKGNKIIRSSAGVLKQYARSAIAIKGDNILLIAVSNEKPMTIKELSALLKQMDVDSAMALDGGSSTSMYIKNIKFILNSAKDAAARKVKSIILIRNE